jgi:hypothetical protein
MCIIAWCISGFPVTDRDSIYIAICNLTFFLLCVFYRRRRVDMNCSENFITNLTYGFYLNIIFCIAIIVINI